MEETAAHQLNIFRAHLGGELLHLFIIIPGTISLLFLFGLRYLLPSVPQSLESPHAGGAASPGDGRKSRGLEWGRGGPARVGRRLEEPGV